MGIEFVMRLLKRDPHGPQSTIDFFKTVKCYRFFIL